MADLKMKINNTNDLRLKMKSNEIISMKFDDYQKFKEEDPIFKDSPAYTITFNDIYKWNHKSDFSGNYYDLTNKPNLEIYATKSELSGGLSNKVDKVEGMGLSQNSFTTDEKNKLASLENYDDSEIVSELNNKADISDIPTKTSELLNDSGYITKDVNDLTYYPTNDSVNSIVALKQNLITSDNMVSSDLIDDTSSTNKFVTASDITAWNNKSDFSGDYNDLTNKPTIPVVPTTVSSFTNDAGYITKSVNDLTNYTLSSSLSTVATSGSYADLSNKPTIPTAETINTYSTSNEVPCGTWVDGKTIYRKVFYVASFSASLYQIGTITNLDTLVSIKGTAQGGSALSNQHYGIPNVHSNIESYYINALVNQNSEVQVRKGSGIATLYNVYVICEYTKSS